jgi:hypothetical protein
MVDAPLGVSTETFTTDLPKKNGRAPIMDPAVIAVAQPYAGLNDAQKRDFQYLGLHPELIPPRDLQPAADTEKNRFVIRDAAFFLQPREPIEQIIGKIVAKGSVNTLVGKYGSKKTWFALWAAVCVALHKPCLGFPTTQGTVLLIDEESGEERLSRRMGMAIRGALGDKYTPVKSVSLGQFNLLKSPNDAVLLAALIREVTASMVIIDALCDIMASGDENAVKDTQPVFMALRKIAETTGAAIVVIHHTGKNNDYRGSSAIPGAIDTMLLIESQEGSPLITFKTLKNRDGEPVEFAARATWTEDQFYLTEAELPAGGHLSKSQKFTLEFFEDNGEATLQQVNNHAGGLFSEGTIKKAIQFLVSEKKITRINVGGKGIEAIYAITRNSPKLP